MLALFIALDLTGLPAQMANLRSELDVSMAAGLELVSEVVATDGRSSHAYENRTGDLEESTVAAGTVGSFLSGNLESGVIASEEYASFVDGREEFAFLQPAFERSESAGYAILQDALDSACARAWP